MSARLIKVIESQETTRGDGRATTMRYLTRYFDEGGQLLAEHDPAEADENAVLLEFTVRTDSAFSSSGSGSGRDDRRRWALRAELAPEIGILPGHQAPSFGFEVSRSFDGGPPAVKILYGVSLSASKGIFKQ